MRCRLVSFSIVIFLMMFPLNAFAVGIEVAVGGWHQAISGTLSYSETLLPDTIDLENDIDFDDETRFLGRVKIDMPLILPNIYIVAAPMSFDGAGVKSGTLNFGDYTFDFSTGLESEITINQYDIGLYYGLPFLETVTFGKFNIDLGLNVRLVDFEANVKGTVAGATVEESESLDLAIPMLYVGVQLTPIDSLAFEAEGRGIVVGDNKVYSLLGRVRYNFVGPLFVAAGYRMDKVEIDEDDVDADVKFAGPFIEGGFKF